MKSSKNKVVWYAVAALFVILIGLLSYMMNSNKTATEDLGTFDDPELAFRETQKMLSLLSEQLNFGIENVLYIQEYEDSKSLIFKPIK
jgi:hypothetical protein